MRGLGVWILLGALWLANLPLRPLFDPDEGRYAEIPREMAASGDWVTPTLDNLKYLEKPPLQYWTTAALYSVFGVHEWTARLWATALAFLCIPMVFVFALRFGYSTEQASVAAVLLAINPYFALTGQVNLLDQGFCFFLLLGVLAFLLSQLERDSAQRARNWMLLTWAALALAVLTKGIVALVLAGAALVVHMVVSRDGAPLKRLHLALGVPLFLLITVPWFWLVQSRNPEFLWFFFVREHVERFLTTVDDRVEPWWYFLGILMVALLPVIWNLRSWKLLASARTASHQAFHVERFLLIWCGVVLLLFSVSQSKLSAYILPIMPALALLLARDTAAHPHAYRRAAITTIVLLLVIAVGMVVVGARKTGTVQPAAIFWGGVVLALLLVFTFWLRSRAASSPTRRWLALAAVSIAAYQCLFMSYAATFSSRTTVPFIALMRERISAATRLYNVGQFRHSLTFYLQRPVNVYDYAGELEFGMRQAGMTTATQSREQFLAAWQGDTDALAVIERGAYAKLRAAGMPGTVITQDAHSYVVSRK